MRFQKGNKMAKGGRRTPVGSRPTRRQQEINQAAKEEPRGESPIFLSRNRVRITTRSLHSVMDDANHAIGSASLTPMYGDFLETLPDSVAHPLER